MNGCTRFWRITSVVVGLITLGLGLDSHFNSDWRANSEMDDPCQQKPLFNYGRGGKWCPHISIEEYFVSVTIICFILSLISLGYSFKVEKSSSIMKKLDIVYHSLATILLVIAGSLYIASAIQAVNFRLHGEKGELQLRTTEKVIAGCFSIIQALVYCALACIIGKEN